MKTTPPPNTKPRKLSGKQKMFIAEYISNGQNGTQSALKAYNTDNENVASSIANENLRKPDIQLAIEKALENVGATPEFAVNQLYHVAQQDEELGAKRLASKDILELHGWRKGDIPSITLNMRNQFFGDSRRKRGEVIDQA